LPTKGQWPRIEIAWSTSFSAIGCSLVVLEWPAFPQAANIKCKTDAASTALDGAGPEAVSTDRR